MKKRFVVIVLALVALGMVIFGTACAGYPDGTYIVGSTIQPGTYQNSDSSAGCYWERLSGFGGTLDEIISNEFTFAPSIVTIAPTDVGFKTLDCGVWVPVIR